MDTRWLVDTQGLPEVGSSQAEQADIALAEAGTVLVGVGTGPGEGTELSRLVAGLAEAGTALAQEGMLGHLEGHRTWVAGARMRNQQLVAEEVLHTPQGAVEVGHRSHSGVAAAGHRNQLGAAAVCCCTAAEAAPESGYTAGRRRGQSCKRPAVEAEPAWVGPGVEVEQRIAAAVQTQVLEQGQHPECRTLVHGPGPLAVLAEAPLRCTLGQGVRASPERRPCPGSSCEHWRPFLAGGPTQSPALGAECEFRHWLCTAAAGTIRPSPHPDRGH